MINGIIVIIITTTMMTQAAVTTTKIDARVLVKRALEMSEKKLDYAVEHRRQSWGLGVTTPQISKQIDAAAVECRNFKRQSA